MSDDAWKQMHDLTERFTREWTVRSDLEVVAVACERGVILNVDTTPPGTRKPFDMKRWHSTQRNVGTMRELANALLAACDFVDQSNPVWASHHDRTP